MMLLTPALLRNAYTKLGYAYSDKYPNLTGIRTSLIVPDTFNDVFVATFKQPVLPKGYTVLQIQQFLNYWSFKGANNLPLIEDGVKGANSDFAFAQYFSIAGKERLLSWVCTTIPGLFYLQNPVVGGCAVLKPGQYKNAYILGNHQGRADHPALVQQGGEVIIYRDNDRDNLAEETATTSHGYFGINIHRSNEVGATPRISNWSAGCQVFQRHTDHEQMLNVCRSYKALSNNRFTYTLLREREL
jgi:hypothetical protein